MDWLTPHFPQAEEWAAVDVAVHEAFRHVSQDQRQRAIFDGQLWLLNAVPVNLPFRRACFVMSPDRYVEVTSPGVFRVDFSILLTARFIFPRTQQVMGPGLATLVNSWIRLLYSPGARLLPVTRNGRTFALVKESRPAEGISLQPLPLASPDQEDVIFDATLRWDYVADLDPDTRRLWPLVFNAGE